MQYFGGLSPKQTFLKLATIAAYMTFVIGVLAITGWVFQIEFLTSIEPGFASMKVNTALAFILSGLTLRLQLSANQTNFYQRISAFFCLIVSILGVFTICEYIFHFTSFVDVYPTTLDPGFISAFGRMAPATATGLIVLGWGYFTLLSSSKVLALVSQTCILFCLSLGLVGLIGYLYDVETLYRTAPFSSVSINTSIAFFLAGFGGLCARPERGWMRRFSSPTLGGIVSRRTLPVAIVVPFALGWLILKGQLLGYYGTEFGLVLIVVSNILVFSCLIWSNARLMDKIVHERDLIADDKNRMAYNLAASTTQFKHLVQSINDYAISSLDLDGFITSWNVGAEHILGYKDQEIIGQNFSIFYPKDEIANTTPKEIIEQATALGRFEAQTWHVRKDGSKFWATVIINVTRDDNGKHTGFAKMTRDVTASKQATDLLLESEERLQSVVNNVVDGIVTIDAKGIVQSMNTAAERLFAWSSQEIVGQNVKILMPDPFQVEHDSYISNYLRTGSKKIIGIGREVVGLRKDKTTFPVELSVSEFHQRGQRFFTGIIRDITERKENERRIFEQNRSHQEILESRVAERTNQLSTANRVLETTVAELKSSREELRLLSRRFHLLQEKERSRIAKEIHDELGQMLAVMKLELVQLKRQSKDLPAVLEKVVALVNSVDQTIVMLRRVSSDLKPVVLEQLGLGAALEWLAMDISKRTGISCQLNAEIEWPGKDVEIATGLFRVIQEAITNALKHSGTDKIDISIKRDAENWFFAVRDYGKGISPESERRASSLGMTGMRERVLAIGGKIDFQRVPSGGTLVVVELPRTQDGAPIS